MDKNNKSEQKCFRLHCVAVLCAVCSFFFAGTPPTQAKQGRLGPTLAPKMASEHRAWGGECPPSTGGGVPPPICPIAKPVGVFPGGVQPSPPCRTLTFLPLFRCLREWPPPSLGKGKGKGMAGKGGKGLDAWDHGFI